MRRLLLITALVTVLSLVTTSTVLADSGDGEDSVTTGEVAMLLAPVVGAALAVERRWSVATRQRRRTAPPC